MTRLIDETWCVDMSDLHNAVGFDGAEMHRARARLAAAAPAMARLLVDLEWGADICIGYDNITALGCPSCGGLQHDPGTRADFDHHTVGHDPDCALVAVLRAAGVME